MKRSPLRRGKPIARRAAKPMKRTPGKQRNRYADKAAMDAFKETHLSCGCCWKPTWKVWGGLHPHHVLNGKFCRKDHPANVIMLCGPCHRELDTGCVGIVLTLKMEDTATWDLEWLPEWARRFKRILPDAEPLPDWILTLRESWNG